MALVAFLGKRIGALIITMAVVLVVAYLLMYAAPGNFFNSSTIAAGLGQLRLQHPELYQQYIKQVMRERGFDDERVSQKFMLLLEEAGEFAQSARKNAHLAQATDSPVEDLNDAAADVFAVLLDLCNQLNIDLEQAFIVREHKNQTRTWE